jgi:hypothetical protein
MASFDYRRHANGVRKQERVGNKFHKGLHEHYAGLPTRRPLSFVLGCFIERTALYRSYRCASLDCPRVCIFQAYAHILLRVHREAHQKQGARVSQELRLID